MNKYDKHTLWLRALTALLSYPTPELREAMSEIEDVIDRNDLVCADTRDQLLALCAEIATDDELDVQGRYVDLFDRGRRTSLDVFQHVHGDDRSRGPAMVDLKQQYEKAGLTQSGNELPDHLPVILEFLSCCDLAEARHSVVMMSEIVRDIGNALLHQGSSYAVIMAALLEFAAEEGLDPSAEVPEVDDYEKTWVEEPAFANTPQTCGISAQEVAVPFPESRKTAIQSRGSKP